MKNAILFRVLAVLLITLFICASLLKSIGEFNSFFQAAENIVGGDKTLHVIATFCIAFLVNIAVSTHYHQTPKEFFNRTLICLLVLISVDELLQLLSANRRFSFADLTANYVGLLLGWGASRLLLKTTAKNNSQCS